MMASWPIWILTLMGDASEVKCYHHFIFQYMAVCQNLVPLVNIKIAGKWMFIPLKMVLIGIDPYPYVIDFLINVHCIWPGTEQDQYQLAVSLAFD